MGEGGERLSLKINYSGSPPHKTGHYCASKSFMIEQSFLIAVLGSGPFFFFFKK